MNGKKFLPDLAIKLNSLLEVIMILFFGLCFGFNVLLLISTIKDLLPDKDEVEFQRKMLELNM
jgi:hypothetical protein